MRSELFGDFIPLDRALEIVALRVQVASAEIEDVRRNRCVWPDRWAEIAERKAIHDCLADSKAAGLLLGVFNKPKALRIEWFALTQGFPVRDDRVGIDGMQWLVARLNAPLPGRTQPAGRWGAMSAQDPAVLAEVPDVRAREIGFNVDELIALLDRESI